MQEEDVDIVRASSYAHLHDLRVALKIVEVDFGKVGIPVYEQPVFVFRRNPIPFDLLSEYPLTKDLTHCPVCHECLPIAVHT